MARTLKSTMLALATLSWIMLALATVCWLGLLGAPAQAQVSVDLGPVGGADVGVDVGLDVGGAVEGAPDSGPGPVGDAVGGALEGLTPGDSTTATRLDQSLAIEAVQSHRALPLEQIMTKARLHTQGEIVDAQLISVRGFLLYELKVVEANGDVGELYFYALSGELVQTN
jgi:hypothetical protein